MKKKKIIKYIYPNSTNYDLQSTRQNTNNPIIHANVSTYTQSLIQFHKSNLVPDRSSNKRLKLQFNNNFNSSKRDSTPDTPSTIHNKGDTKSVTFVDEDEPTTLFQQILNMKKICGVPPHINNQISLQKMLLD